MTAPKLALSRPAALAGRVGQGGDNRVHDVALVQALLGAKRAKGGWPYLNGNVTGSYDKETAVALLRFRMDQRDASIKRPLARSGPLLNKLAQGQALAVLEGTATPYSYATMAEAGPIRGLKAKDLSAERKVELMQVMRDVTRDWGIAFDVEVTVAPFDPGARSVASSVFDSRPLAARFTPRKFFVQHHLHERQCHGQVRQRDRRGAPALPHGPARRQHQAAAGQERADAQQAGPGPGACRARRHGHTLQLRHHGRGGAH